MKGQEEGEDRERYYYTNLTKVANMTIQEIIGKTVDRGEWRKAVNTRAATIEPGRRPR